MAKNVGSIDRVIRLVAGVLLLALPFFSGMAFFDSSLMRYGSLLVGAVLIVTALVNFCPLYKIFGIRTCKI